MALAAPLGALAQQTTWNASLWGQPRAFPYHVERLAEGRLELAQFCAGHHPDKTRAITVLELPFP